MQELARARNGRASPHFRESEEAAGAVVDAQKPLYKTVVHDTDHSAFRLAVMEATAVIGRVFAFDKNARRALEHVVSARSVLRRVVMLHRRGRRTVGYHFLTYETVELEGRRVCVCRSLAGFQPGSRGTHSLVREAFVTTLRVLLQVRMPMYLITVSATPSDYKSLATATNQLYPSPGYGGDDLTPAVLEACMADWQAPSSYVPRIGEVTKPDPDVDSDFFLARRPHYRDGIGLPVCVPLNLRTVMSLAFTSGETRTLRR